VLIDGVFYGLAFSTDSGTAFASTPGGQFTSLHQFGANSFSPGTFFALRYDGNLYGYGFGQGSTSDGVIFVMTTSAW
jgi:hypothetical protein